MRTYVPLVLRDDIEEVQIQPAKTERPLADMPIRALEVGASSFEARRDVPAAATLVRDDGKTEVRSGMLRKFRVVDDRMKSIVDRKIGSS